jgi:predicted metal-dependent hydrolase
MYVPSRKYWKKKKIRLEVLPDGTLQVTAPHHCDIDPFLEHNKVWIERKLGEVTRIVHDHPGCDDLFLFQGSWYRLTKGDSCEILEDIITYTTPKALKERLEALLRQEVEEQIVRCPPSFGASVKSISIRTQRTRWGSCSGEGVLNFNLTMMALPVRLRTYIILHELVHLVERNHAPAFWNLLESLCPDYKRLRKELKTYWMLVERNSIWRVLRDR